MRTPARGRFSVNPATGRIPRLRAAREECATAASSRPIVYWMLVELQHPTLGWVSWVPVRMLERHYRDGATRVLEAEMQAKPRTRNYHRCRNTQTAVPDGSETPGSGVRPAQAADELPEPVRLEEIVEQALVFAPLALHLDVEVEEHARIEESLELEPRGGADRA